MNKVKRIALTLGEPSGIGPDIFLQIAQKNFSSEIVVIASPTLLEKRAKLLNMDIHLKEFDPSLTPRKSAQGHIQIYPISLESECIPGILNVKNTPYVLNTLSMGYKLCEEKICDALVTGPVNKKIINESGIKFSGHTEFLQDLAKVDAVLMVFYSPSLMVGLVTTHCALNQVSHLLTEKKLIQALTLLHHGLIHIFKIPNPTINVCGLNPHAGENGILGTEEQTLIIPIIYEFQNKAWQIKGPYPADTAFSPEMRKNCHAILAMYHDQGLIPIKALYFNEIVNITLGLPFLRTSVDHGTALNLAGTGKSNPLSLEKAIEAAIRFS